MVRFDAKWKAGNTITPSHISMKFLSIESRFADQIGYLAGHYCKRPRFPKWKIRLSDMRELSSKEREFFNCRYQKGNGNKTPHSSSIETSSFCIIDLSCLSWSQIRHITILLAKVCPNL